MPPPPWPYWVEAEVSADGSAVFPGWVLTCFLWSARAEPGMAQNMVSVPPPWRARPGRNTRKKNTPRRHKGTKILPSRFREILVSLWWHAFACQWHGGACPCPRFGQAALWCPSGKSVCVQGKSCPVTLKRPGRGTTAAGTAKPPPEIMLCFVEARAINPPEGVTPARWRPLTTHAAATLAGASRTLIPTALIADLSPSSPGLTRGSVQARCRERSSGDSMESQNQRLFTMASSSWAQCSMAGGSAKMCQSCGIEPGDDV